MAWGAPLVPANNVAAIVVALAARAVRREIEFRILLSWFGFMISSLAGYIKCFDRSRFSVGWGSSSANRLLSAKLDMQLSTRSSRSFALGLTQPTKQY